MLPHLLILLMFCRVSKQLSVRDQEEYLLKLTPEQVRQAFDNVITDEYIKELAKEFAARAATHFMKEITNHKNLLLSQLKLKRSAHSEYLNTAQVKNTEEANVVETVKQEADQTTDSESKEEDKPTKSELDDMEALKLLEDPAPDGDNLDTSGELSDDEKNKIPVIQLTKINGIYYRRLLGMI
ncbi:unnamed protein product [Arctia plantaginis]|uniref:Uncharacterized protein n=1 Tax=Arctia plantaginis TaxID=874455 RepID=A0A8S1A3P0_ARCPL|nr:unnamed protein product [Arctia plantaginis]